MASGKMDRGSSSRDDSESSWNALKTNYVLFVASTVFLWGVVAYAVCSGVPSSPGAAKSRSAREGTEVHLLGLSAFVCLGFLSASAAWISGNQVCQTSALIPLGVALCGGSCYGLIGLGASPVWISKSYGIAVFPLRNITWCFTTTLMIFSTWLPSGQSVWRFALCVAFDVAMALTGLAAAVQSGAPLWGCFSLSCICFAAMGYLQWQMVAETLKKCEDLPLAQNSLRRLRMILLVVWNVFGAVFVVQYTGAVSGKVAEICTVLADIVAKVVCAGSIVQGAVAATGEYGLMKLEKVTKMFAEKTAEHTTLLKGKDQAFAAMAHELRTPLNGIIGLTDSLLWSETNSMSKRAIGSLKIVRDTSRRLSQIIGNIMDNAAANAEKLILVLEDVKLFPVIEEVVTLVNPLLSRDTHIIVDVPEDLPAVRADSTRVMQILFNLIGNAAKFTEKGTITLTSTVNENFVCLRIKDTGIGIPKDKIDLIFNEYETGLKSQHSRSHGSTGLGLSMAKKLVHAHGGSLRVTSTEGRGSTFSGSHPSSNHGSDIQAPERPFMLSDWMDMRKGINVQETSHDGLPDVSDISILSVDDDSVNHFVIEELMSSNGCKVTKAMDAREALDILHEIYLDKGTEGFPDVVLMDQRMPHMTGLEATKIIRQRYPSSKMPIIMLSANNDEESVCEGLTVGCNDYVSKPFKRLELLARISLQVRMLRYHQREVEARQNERILTEILPKSVIERLKNGTTRIADKLDNVTILFSDIVGFTSLTASVSTIDIISMLDDLFSKFDTLVEHHGVYKVETIGDAYMIVAGHEYASAQDHAERMVLIAKDMIRVASETTTPLGGQLKIRVGIHSGPAYAGVVGHKCPRYCLFGDTVNTASRMESNGFPMCIHMSDSTYNLVARTGEEFVAVGARNIKGKGMMHTWLLQHGDWEAALESLKYAPEPRPTDSARASLEDPTPMVSQTRISPMEPLMEFLTSKLDSLPSNSSIVSISSRLDSLMEAVNGIRIGSTHRSIQDITQIPEGAEQQQFVDMASRGPAAVAKVEDVSRLFQTIYRQLVALQKAVEQRPGVLSAEDSSDMSDLPHSRSERMPRAAGAVSEFYSQDFKALQRHIVNLTQLLEVTNHKIVHKEAAGLCTLSNTPLRVSSLPIGEGHANERRATCTWKFHSNALNGDPHVLANRSPSVVTHSNEPLVHGPADTDLKGSRNSNDDSNGGDAELAGLLGELGLEHYADSMRMHGATMSSLMTCMGPMDLQRFGVFRDAAQKQIFEAFNPPSRGGSGSDNS